MNFENKKVVLMGLGSYKDGSGISAALYFAKKGAELLITDLKTKKELAPQIKRLKRTLSPRTDLGSPKGRSLAKIKYVLGKHRMQDFQNADYVFKNPSVPKDSPYLKIARKNKIPIINDWMIFFEERPNNLLIGITGTKGKSTTATLIYQILKAAKKDAVLCGNIGQSPLSILHKIKKNTVVVAELSSWLLHDFKKSPQISVITNLMPEHLDKYKNLKEYYEDKENIFKFQNKNDYLILNKNDKNLRKIANKAKSAVIWCDGNPQNAAMAIAKILSARGESALGGKISEKTARKAMKNFKGLPGRLELIAEKNGVKYINDTTATMPDATIHALNFLKKYRGRIILIAGGVDKKLDYKNLAKEILKYCKAIVLFKGTASDKIIKKLKIKKLKLKIRTGIMGMEEAVETAREHAFRGDIIILSPASASFNLFKNEFDRGGQFVKFVKQLK